MKFLITGCGGFIGSHLVNNLLVNNHVVYGIDILPLNKLKRISNLKGNKNFKYFKMDISKSKNFFKSFKKVDVVYHLASVVGVQNYIKDTKNLIYTMFHGTDNIINYCKKNNVFLVYASTSEVYGKNNNVPWSEDGDRVLGPTYIKRWSYSTSKAHAEHLLYSYASDINFTIVRFFNIYGPSQNPIYVMSNNIHRAINDKELIVYDDGLQTRCFTFVEDAIKCLKKIYRSKIKLNHQIINIGSNKESTMKYAINCIASEIKKPLKIKKINTKKLYDKNYEDIPRRIPKVDKAFKLLKWRATTSIKDGIKRTIKWSISHDGKWWLKSH